MPTFQDNLATFPDIAHLAGLDIRDGAGQTIHHIPAVQGKLGSLKLYHALCQQFHGQLNPASAQQGLDWFAEHTADALAHPDKHPNIDLLLRVVAEKCDYTLHPIAA